MEWGRREAGSAAEWGRRSSSGTSTERAGRARVREVPPVKGGRAGSPEIPAGVDPDESSCGHAARACGRAGAWEAALALARRSSADFGIAPTDRMWCAALQAHGVAGKYGAAIDLLDEIASAEGRGGQPPTVQMCGAAMSAIAYAPAGGGQGGGGGGGGAAWAQCLDLLERMEEMGAVLDVGVYDSALHACQRAGKWEQVRALLYEMRRKGVTTAETLKPFHLTLWKRAQKEMRAGK